MKLRLFLTLFLVAGFSLFIPSQVRAQTQVCQAVESRIDQHINRYNEHKDSFTQRVNEAIAKLKEIDLKLKDQGCDTSQLETDYQSLASRLSGWVNDYNTFINLLNESKSLACGESQGGYRYKVSQARDQLRVVRSQGIDLTNFYTFTIKPHIASLKSQCFGSAE